MEIPVKKAINIIDGEHEGVVFNVRYRKTPYEYVDVEVKLMQGKDEIDLKVGYPMVLSKQSKLGQLIERFGVPLVDGESVDPDKVLIGQRCKFKTYTTESKKGKFAQIIPDSLRLSDGIQTKF